MSVIAAVVRRGGLAGPAQGWLPLVVLLALVMSVIYSIDQARWAANTEIMYPMAILGILAGTWLSNRRMRSPLIIALGVTAGGLIAFVVVSETFPGPADLVPNFVDLFRRTVEWVQARRGGEAVGPQPLAGAIRTSWEFLLDLWIRFLDWFEVVSTFKPSTDNVIFLLWMAYAAWGMGFIGAWGLFRRRSIAIAASGAAVGLAVNITYVGPTRLPFVIFMIALLLLMVQVNLFVLADRWQRTRIEYSAELGINVTALSLVLIAVVTLFAVFFPRVRGNPLSESFWTYMGDGWSNVEAATNRLFSGVSNPAGASTLSGPQQLPVGAVLPFTRKATLIVQSTHEAYWRGATFDRFFGDRWENTDKALTARDPGQALTKEVELKARLPVRANFEILDSDSYVLYIPGEVITLNRNYLIQSAVENEVLDYSSIRATRRIGRRIAYSVESSISGAGVVQLREAGTKYPAWIDKYLQLPDVTPRVRELASRFARPGDNAYDRAQRLEFFLRRYPFALDVAEPEPGQDVVDYYLFELRRGYADYTASAMAVLARLNGIPARVATGYLPGVFDEDTGRFIAGPEDAHTWVEVFFPAYGWITFEPSGYRVPVTREEGTAAGIESGGVNPMDIYDLEELLHDLAVDSTAGDFGANDFSNPFIDFFRGASGIIIVLGGIIGAMATVFFGYLMFGFIWGRFQSPKTAVRKTYRKMLRYARWAGYNPREVLTPLELAHGIAADFYQPDGAASRGIGARVASPLAIAGEIHPPIEIARLYARALYSDHGVLPVEKRAAARAWKRLRPRLVRHIVRMRRKTAR